MTIYETFWRNIEKKDLSKAKRMRIYKTSSGYSKRGQDQIVSWVMTTSMQVLYDPELWIKIVMIGMWLFSGKKCPIHCHMAITLIMTPDMNLLISHDITKRYVSPDNQQSVITNTHCQFIHDRRKSLPPGKSQMLLHHTLQPCLYLDMEIRNNQPLGNTWHHIAYGILYNSLDTVK